MMFTDDDESGPSRACELVIELPDDLSADQARTIVSEQLRLRLANASDAREEDDLGRGTLRRVH